MLLVDEFKKVTKLKFIYFTFLQLPTVESKAPLKSLSIIYLNVWLAIDIADDDFIRNWLLSSRVLFDFLPHKHLISQLLLQLHSLQNVSEI